MKARKIQAITFDAGGTLLYPYPAVGAIYAEVMSQHGLILDPDRLEAGFRRAWKNAHQIPRVSVSETTEKEWWRRVVRETLNGLGEPSDFEALFCDLWSAFAEPRRWRLHDEAEETLRVLRKRSYRLLILSNWDSRLRLLLVGLGIASLFDDLIISSEVGFEKPDRRIFQVAENRLALPADRFLHVGDSDYHDAEGARGAGWQWVLVTNQPVSGESTNRIQTLSELLDRLP